MTLDAPPPSLFPSLPWTHTSPTRAPVPHLSVRRQALNCFFQTVILLYLVDKGAAWVVRASSSVGYIRAMEWNPPLNCSASTCAARVESFSFGLNPSPQPHTPPPLLKVGLCIEYWKLARAVGLSVALGPAGWRRPGQWRLKDTYSSAGMGDTKTYDKVSVNLRQGARGGWGRPRLTLF